MKAVLFDLDGTLLDRDTSLRQFIIAQHQRLAALHHVPLEGYLSRFIELDCRGAVWKDKVYQQLLDEFSVPAISWNELLNDYETHFMRHCIPFPNLFLTLDALQQNYALGLITNGRGRFQTRAIEGLGIAHYFDAILISETEGVRKPDIDIFQRAMNRLGVDAAASAFVGDHPEADIAGARRAGMRTIWKRDLYWPPADADATADDLSEIPAIIRKFEV